MSNDVSYDDTYTKPIFICVKESHVTFSYLM